MNSLPTATKSIASVSSLCILRMAKELKRLHVIVDLSHVFKRLAEENDLSGVHDVAGLIMSKLQIVITFGISLFSAWLISFSFS